MTYISILNAVALVSNLFYAATIFVYAYLKELRSEVAGKMLLSFTTLLFMQNIIVPARNLDLFLYTNVGVYLIMLYGIHVIASLLYLWMSAMTFDIWWTFR